MHVYHALQVEQHCHSNKIKERERIACNMNLLTHTHMYTHIWYILCIIAIEKKIKFYHKLIFITLQVEGVSECWMCKHQNNVTKNEGRERERGVYTTHYVCVCVCVHCTCLL